MLSSFLYVVFAVAFTFATAWALGALAFRALSIPWNYMEERLVGVLCGAACLSVIVFALCALSLARKGVYFGLGSGSIAAAMWLRAPALQVAQAKKMAALAVVAGMFAIGIAIVRGDLLSQIDQAHGFGPGAIHASAIFQMAPLFAFAFGRQPAATLVDYGLVIAALLLVVSYGQSLASRLPRWVLRLAAAGSLAAYFIWYAADGLRARLSWDDPMNLAYYWERGTWPLIRAQFEFFSTYLRPMGGMFYMSIFNFAGLNPLPYRIAAFLILLLNVAVFYRCARWISGSERVGWLAAALAAYHPHLMPLYYDNDVIYDVLCFLFYFAALGWYVGIRSRGHFCTWRQTGIFLALYICALNSKEMAVTLPVTLVAYELLFHFPVRVKEWFLHEGRVPCIAAIVTAVYVFGKVFGADPLVAMPGYRPEFTLQRFLSTVTENIRTLFYLPDGLAPAGVIAMWVALLILAWAMKSKYAAFCLVFAAVCELPIAFIGRTGASLYIPLGAWAMLVAAVIWRAAEFAAVWLRPRAGQAFVAATLAVSLVLLSTRLVPSERQWTRSYILDQQDRISSALEQFRELKINPRQGASIAFLNDPFGNFNMLFFAELWFRDHSLNVHLLKQTPMPREAVLSMDYIIDYRDGRFLLVN